MLMYDLRCVCVDCHVAPLAMVQMQRVVAIFIVTLILISTFLVLSLVLGCGFGCSNSSNQAPATGRKNQEARPVSGSLLHAPSYRALRLQCVVTSEAALGHRVCCTWQLHLLTFIFTDSVVIEEIWK